MLSARINKLSNRCASKTFVSFILLVIFTACGTNSSAISSPSQSHQIKGTNKSGSVNKHGNTTDPLTLNASNITINSSSLRIQSVTGFQCPNDAAFSNPGALNQLVFSSDPTTYSQKEIAQIQSYLGSTNPRIAVPSTLRMVLGGSVDRIPGADSGENFIPCGAKLTLTNMGSTPIQIPQVGVQLEEHPEQNTYQYRLIDACSLTQQSPCPPLAGAGGVCTTYLAPILLGVGEKGTPYSTEPTGTGNNCGTLTITPTTPVNLIFIFSLATSVPKNLIFSVMPTLTIDTGQGKQTLFLSQFISTLTFASANQFSCYALQGTTFVLLKSPSSPPNWCV